MFAATSSCAHEGVGSYIVRVETRVTEGLPKVTMVGLPDAAAREGAERVRAALRATEESFPVTRWVVNLSPASRRKSGSGFDLAIAVSLLAASDKCVAAPLRDTCFVGELGLDGTLRAIPGALPAARAAAAAGRRRIVVPADNAEEAALARNISVYPAATLKEALAMVQADFGPSVAPLQGADPSSLLRNRARSKQPDLGEVRGLEQAKRALMIAAAGEHHLLMCGPPGSGKSMLARRLPGLLPDMNLEEAVETTEIHSIAGLSSDGPLIVERPFRAPHHSTSSAGLVGGGTTPSPGEISLAHNGTLFLDELPEFPVRVLNQLREPLEDRRLTISRAGSKLTFPAHFQLVAAMNPCPCGYYSTGVRECRCPDHAIQRYRNRLSGPLLDRIDLHVNVPYVKYDELAATSAGTSSADARGLVDAARERRRAQRSQGETVTPIDADAEKLLSRAVQRLALSGRSTVRTRDVAGTIAALEGRDRIEQGDIAEALQYRPQGSMGR